MLLSELRLHENQGAKSRGKDRPDNTQRRSGRKLVIELRLGRRPGTDLRQHDVAH